MVLFITNLVKKSLAIELDCFFTFIDEKVVPTKGAFSQARYKLKAVFFQDWNQYLISRWFALKANDMRRWKGFQLCAMDGTARRPLRHYYPISLLSRKYSVAI